MAHLTHRPATVRRLSRLALIGAAALAAACAAFEALPGFGRRAAERWAFVAPQDARSAASFVRHRARLDAAVTGWIALDTLNLRPLELYADTLGAPGRGDARRLAVVTTGAADAAHPATVRALAADEGALARTAGAVAALSAARGYRGLVLDFAGLEPRDRGALQRVVRAIGDSARARGVAPVAVAVPAADTAAYPARALIGPADLIVVLLYDQHWPGSPPGPIAEPDWVRRQLGVRVSEVGAARIVAALPLYGYQWRTGLPAERIGFDDARRIAAEAGLLLEREPGTRTLRASRVGVWELWVSDAELLDALLREVADAGVRRVALWRLGLEDPALWRDVLR